MDITDAEGKFAISGFPAGSYSIVAGAEGFQLLETARSDLKEGQQFAKVLKINTQGNPGQLTLAGKVLDQNGQPVANMPVAARDAAGLERRIVWTDEKGAFLINQLPAGTWTLLVKHPGANPGEQLASSAIQTKTNTRVDLSVNLHDINAIVLQPNGQPAQAATVEVQSNYLLQPRKYKMAENGNGRFKLTQLPSGNLTITATAPGVREAVRTVDPNKEKNVTLQLSSQSSLTFKIVEQRTGEPLPNVPIEISEMVDGNLRSRLAGQTLADGTFTDTRVKVGSVQILVRNAGAKHARTTVDVVPGKVNGPLVMKLDRSCQVEGILVDANGKIVDATMVLEAWPIARFLMIEYDSAQGCIKSLPGRQKASMKVPPGEYDIRATVKLSGPQYTELSRRRLLFGQPPMEVLTQSTRVNLWPNQNKQLRMKLQL